MEIEYYYQGKNQSKPPTIYYFSFMFQAYVYSAEASPLLPYIYSKPSIPPLALIIPSFQIFQNPFFRSQLFPLISFSSVFWKARLKLVVERQWYSIDYKYIFSFWVFDEMCIRLNGILYICFNII